MSVPYNKSMQVNICKKYNNGFYALYVAKKHD